MKRLLILGLTLAVVVGAAAIAHFQTATKSGDENSPEFRHDVDGKEKPWTSLEANNDPAEFRFCIVSDRTGGHRAEVFSRAVQQINLLQPEFVVSVGDLIEGYTEDKKVINEQWQEFDSYVKKFKMPFFYVPGNHDITNDVQDRIYKERYGRPYYHFVYRDVLFLVVSSEDRLPEEKPADPEKPPEKPKRGSYIDEAQRKYIKKVLEDNPKVRWTLVFLHKPLWYGGEEVAIEKTGWLDVEKMLNGRNYTVFAGHVHRYQKFVRQGMNYYQLATTGGGSRLRGERYGEFDHITWVTMKREGPVLANIMLDGIYPESMEKIRTNEPAVPLKTPRPKVYPTAGTVTYKGETVGGAWVYVWKQDEKTKKYAHVANAMTEPDGSFRLTTYTANDGLPVGKFVVTVIKREPMYEPDGSVGKDVLPKKYGSTATSELQIEAREDNKPLALELK